MLSCPLCGTIRLNRHSKTVMSCNNEKCNDFEERRPAASFRQDSDGYDRFMRNREIVSGGNYRKSAVRYDEEGAD